MSEFPDIVKWPDEVLLNQTKKIKNVSSKIEDLSTLMVDMLKPAAGVGLAANQIGQPLQLIVADLSAAYEDRDDEPVVLINPEIVHFEGKEVMEEGCLSLPGYNADVPRAFYVVVKAFDINEKPVELEEEGYAARVLQHEIDHLNGKLFPDRLSRLKKNLLYQKVKKAIKNGTFGE